MDPPNQMMTPRCLFLVHVYYPELWPEIGYRLRSLLGHGFDLQVNSVEGRTTPEWRRGLLRDFPHSQVLVSPNLGLDVGGTLRLLGRVELGRYDLVCKLHTKKCEHSPVEGERWRDDLLRACLDNVDEVLEVFRSRPDVTMLASGARAMVGNGINHRACLRLCDKLRIDRRFAHGAWPAGCMFWCRPYVMQALKDTGIAQADFPVGYGLDGTLAHAIERVFGALARSRGEIYWR